MFLVIKEQKLYQFFADKVVLEKKYGLLFKEFDPDSVLDIVTCTVKPSDDKSFEVFSPNLKKALNFEVFHCCLRHSSFKTESEADRDEWIKSFQSAVSDGLNSLSIAVLHTYFPC